MAAAVSAIGVPSRLDRGPRPVASECQGAFGKNRNASELRIGRRTQLINALRAHLAELASWRRRATQLSRAMSDLNGERGGRCIFGNAAQWTPRNKLMTPNRIVQAMKTNSAAFMIMPIVSRRSAKSRRSISHFASRI